MFTQADEPAYERYARTHLKMINLHLKWYVAKVCVGVLEIASQPQNLLCSISMDRICKRFAIPLKKDTKLQGTCRKSTWLPLIYVKPAKPKIIFVRQMSRT